MHTKDKQNFVVGFSFVVIIGFLIANLLTKFMVLDLAYLLFMVGCFIRFIYIKIR